MKTRLLLVDDHPLLRSGLQQEIPKQPHLEVIGEAGDGATAVKLASERIPDVVIMDIELPDKDGIAVAAQIRNILPEVKIVIFSAKAERALVDKALATGACGYVLKSSAVAELIQAIDMAAAGRLYISPEVSTAILQDYQRTLIGQTVPGKPALTEREQHLLRLVAGGARNKEIAEQLKVSTSSVETYRLRLRRKLNCQTTADLIRFAVSQEIVQA